MATRTSSQTGTWSSTGTWGGNPVPANNDTVIISGGHIVTLDTCDMSGYANGVTLGISGILTVPTTAGIYYLKCAGHITGTGCLSAGSADTPLPSASTFIIDFGGGSRYINTGASGFVDLHGTSPSILYTTLSSAAGIGVVTLPVTDDLTSAGWLQYIYKDIGICNINKGRGMEWVSVSGISATSISITPALSATKLKGAVVALLPRNIILRGSTTYYLYVTSGGVLESVCISGGTYALESSRYPVIDKSVYCKGLSLLENTKFAQVLNSAIIGSTRGVYADQATTMSGGVIAGCQDAFYTTLGDYVDNVYVAGNTNAISYATNFVGRNLNFIGHTTCCVYSNGVVLQDCNWYNNNYAMLYAQLDIINSASSGNSKLFINSFCNVINLNYGNDDFMEPLERYSACPRYYVDSYRSTGSTSGVRMIGTIGGTTTLSAYNDTIETTHPSLGKVAIWTSTGDGIAWVEDDLYINPYETASFTLYGKPSSSNTDPPRLFLNNNIDLSYTDPTYTPLVSAALTSALEWQSSTVQYTNNSPIGNRYKIRLTVNDAAAAKSYFWYKKHSKTTYQPRLP